jgi:hypothetical protein
MGMKHIVVAVTALCVAMVGTPVASAANQGLPSPGYRQLVNELHSPHVWIGRRALPSILSFSRHLQPRASPHQDVSLLGINETAFQPATVKPADEGRLENADADKFIFRQIHSKSYEDLKRISGVAQLGTWNPTGGANDAIYFAYQASTFPDSATSQAAYNDGVAFLQPNNSAGSQSDCSSVATVPCYLSIFGTKGSGTTPDAIFGITVLQVNQCLGELAAFGPQTVVTANADTVFTTLGTMTGYAAAVLKAACGSTSAPSTTLTYSVVKVQFQKPTQDPYSNDPALKKAKPGATVRLVGLFAVTAGPASVPATVSYVIKRGGKVVAQDSQSGTIQPDPKNVTAAVFPLKLPKKVGTYKATMTFQLADQTQQGTASIKVVKKK